MRILQLHNHYRQPGGEDAVVAKEGALLAENGHEMRLCTVSNDSISGPFGTAGVAWKTAYSRSGKAFAARAIADFEPDVVHVHNFFPLLSPAIYDACDNARVPVIQTLHNYRTICAGGFLMRDGRPCEDCIGRTSFPAVMHGCYRQSRIASIAVARMVDIHHKRGTWQSKVDRFIALTRFARGKFIEAGFPADRIAVKGNFVEDPGLVAGADESRRGALFVGRLSPEKGISTLLAAWSNSNLPLRIIGDGPLGDAVQAAQSQIVVGLGRQVTKDVLTEMSRASFLVFPSHWYEGFPVTIGEAFASDLPVIASRLGAMAEIVEDGHTGLLFHPGDANDLADKVRWAADHPDEMRRMGRNARMAYEAKYTPEKNYRQLMEIYEQATASEVMRAPENERMGLRRRD